MSVIDRKRGPASEGPDPLAYAAPGRKRRRSGTDHPGASLPPVEATLGSGDAVVVARLEHVPDAAMEAIVDSLDDRDFAACVAASRLFWVCSKAKTRARLLSKTLAPDEAVLVDDPARVLDYMRRRRGVRFRPHHLRAAAKRDRTDAVRWLIEHADWQVDDASTMALWLAADGAVPRSIAIESDADACHDACRYDHGCDRSGDQCLSCSPACVADQHRSDGMMIRVPLCLCGVGDAAAKRGHHRTLDVLLGTPGYGHTDVGALLAVTYGHVDIAERLLQRGDVGVFINRCWSDSDIVTHTVHCGRADLASRLFEAGGIACSPEVLVHYVPRPAAPWLRCSAWADTTKEPDYYPDVDTDDDDEEEEDDNDPIADSDLITDDNLVDGDDANTHSLAQRRCDIKDRQAYAQMRQVLDSGLILPADVQHAVDRALLFAVYNGRMALVRLLHEKCGARLTDNGMPPGQQHRGHNHTDPLASAAGNNDVRMLTYMIGRRGVAVVGPDAMDDAAQRGALAALTYLADHSDARPSPRALKRAALKGHAAVVSFLCVRAREQCRIGPALRRALARGHNMAAAVLLEHASTADVRHALQTALGNDRARLCRALSLRGDLRDDDIKVPGGDGPTAHVALARQQLYRAQTQGADALAACVAEWGREMAVAAYADQPEQDHLAYNSKIDVLRVILRLGLGTVTRRAMSIAIFNSHVGVMRVLHDHYGDSGPWVGRTFDRSVANATIETLVFMQEHFAWTWWSPGAVDRAAAAGRLDVVRFLHARRSLDRDWCTVAAMDGTVKGTHWRVAAFLHAAGARCTPAVIDKAIGAKRSCHCLWLAPLMEAIHQRSLGAA
ncbi:hypothetical protein pdul_cds_506 [Pandoravirus dulcis]|uniref:Ankyrin repeat domain containing protein n=1 Tax=Pandoravirus dulcis TaxID=1349409 RepID=S4VT58_9VIRU|nr:hypothetical protein pdul_cds_506 [Pandoravirus dulcis]AGO82595.1 hypothetical protein pdul_cds_506 [Pandoravirus dulcis]